VPQIERLYRLKHLLDHRHCVPKATLLATLGVSLATLKRDLAHLRDRMNAPVVFDRAPAPHFQAAGSALPRHQRLQISDQGRNRNLRQAREVSPQRLIHYRDNWCRNVYQLETA